MARIDLDIDNSSGKYDRGLRYNIYADGEIVYCNKFEDEAYRLIGHLENMGYENIQAIEV